MKLSDTKSIDALRPLSRPLSRPAFRLLPAAGLLLLASGAALAHPAFFSPYPFPAPLLALTPPPPAPLRPLAETTGLEETASRIAWAAGSGWSLRRADDPSLQLTGWGDVFDIAQVGAFAIPLRDDPAERTNILLSAQAVDGVVIDPGQTFSFNATVGERTPERGYQDGWMFDHGRLVRGTGGGICLVATGLYNAALRAGLRLVERHPHSGFVGYAPPGCDAGVVYGAEDMRFQNTTPGPLLVRSRAGDRRITLSLIGLAPPVGSEVIVKPTAYTPLPAPVVRTVDPALAPGRTVVDQKARAGFDVTVSRFWTVHHRVVRQEVVTQERRAPRPELVRVAPPVTPAPSVDDALADLLAPSAPAPAPALVPMPAPTHSPLAPEQPSGGHDAP